MTSDQPGNGIRVAPRATSSDVVYGMERAVELARAGRMISAIKHLESCNTGMSREAAKALVGSFGYNGEIRWPEQRRQIVRSL